MENSAIRVVGEMLLRQEYNQTDVCVWGFVENMSSNGKEFTLKATDGKRIPVILREPIGEYIEGLVEVRGHFDGRKLNASNYMQFLREAAEDFDCESYNEAVKLNMQN